MGVDAKTAALRATTVTVGHVPSMSAFSAYAFAKAGFARQVSNSLPTPDTLRNCG
jgi:hypothetical protein